MTRTLQLGLLSAVLAGPAMAQDEGRDGGTHDHVVIILDGSGSMEGMFAGTKKMVGAKKALKAVVANTPEDTRIGLLVFGDNAGWAYPLAPIDKGKLNQAIDGVRSGGGTPLGTYMKIGADALLEEREREHGYGTYRLLVVTDGEAGDPQLVRRYTPDILGRGLVMDVIGVKMDSDHMLKGKAHTYRSADDPEALTQAVSEVFAEVSVTGDDKVGADAFEVLDGLPDEFAMAALAALSASPGRNHPIGEQPPAPGGAEPEPSKQQTEKRTPDGSDCNTAGAPVSAAGLLLAMALVRRERNGR